jgi:hypothetical protein
MLLPPTRSVNDDADDSADMSMQRDAAAESAEGGGRSAAGDEGAVAVDGCDALALEDRDPCTLIGARVVRVCNGAAEEGTVKSFEQHPVYGTLFRAYFPDEDQYAADINALQLHEMLQLAAGGAPAIAAACASTQLVAPRTAPATSARLHAVSRSKPAPRKPQMSLSQSLSPSSPPLLPPASPPPAPASAPAAATGTAAPAGASAEKARRSKLEKVEPAAVKPSRAAQPSPAPQAARDPRRRFKGITPEKHRWRAQVHVPGQTQLLRVGLFDGAEEAARAYDDAAREVGIKTLNYPRPDTDEVQGYFNQGSRARAATVQHTADAEEVTTPAAPSLAPRKRKRDVHDVAALPPQQQEESTAAKTPRMQAAASKRVEPAAASAHDDASFPAGAAGGTAAQAPAVAPPPPLGAGVSQAAPRAAHDGGRGATELVAFLRAIRPPLSHFDVAGTGLTLDRVDAIAAAKVDTARIRMLLDGVADSLGMHLPADQLLFFAAALERVAPVGAVGFGGSINML